ncbi:MAG: LysM peptidoglycan-binding domain-containing protein [Sedimenticola sp.]
MPTLRHKIVSMIFGLSFALGALAADPVAVNPAHPDHYTVVKGDTLWDISGHFLRDPWRWPDVWHVNPQVKNPHLIYPGDVITLSYVNGQPRLSLQRGSVVKLSPRVRSTPLDDAIPAIPIDAIHQFLSRPYVMDREAMESAPYVLAFDDEHVMGSKGIKAYVRAIHSDDNTSFDLIRPGGPYKDADSGEILGYEARYVGNGDLTRSGDPATVVLRSTELETLAGDRLIPTSEDIPMDAFHPKAPEEQVKGSIIAVMGGVSQVGQHQVVVLDRGARDGLEPGTVLAIDQRGRTIRDNISADPKDRVTLPDERAGTLMVFRTFDRVSFALVMAASRTIHVLDRVRNP